MPKSVLSEEASQLLSDIEVGHQRVTDSLNRSPAFQELIRENLVNIWEDDCGIFRVQAGSQV